MHLGVIQIQMRSIQTLITKRSKGLLGLATCNSSSSGYGMRNGRMSMGKNMGKESSVREYRSTNAVRKEDYYRVLGVDRGASKADIKKNYRDQAKKYHPDLNKDNKDAEKKFREATEAYEVLEDDEKRKRYDAYGHAGVDGSNGGGGDPFSGFGGFGGFSGGFGGFGGGGGQQVNPEDIFEFLNQAMGGQGGRRGAGADVEAVVRISFLEAVNGCSKSFEFDYITPVTQRGQKRERKRKSVNIDIPAGVDNNIQMRVPGKGGEGAQGMAPGDLFVRLQVEEDPYFKRDGMNIRTEIPLSFSQAVLGTTLEVLTLDGMVKMKVPSGTQPGAVLTLRGKGVPHVQRAGVRGNHYVTMNLKVPTKLNDRQTELVRELGDIDATTSGSNNGEKMAYSVSSAWNRLKEFVSSKATDAANGAKAAASEAAHAAVDAARKKKEEKEEKEKKRAEKEAKAS